MTTLEFVQKVDASIDSKLSAEKQDFIKTTYINNKIAMIDDCIDYFNHLNYVSKDLEVPAPFEASSTYGLYSQKAAIEALETSGSLYTVVTSMQYLGSFYYTPRVCVYPKVLSSIETMINSHEIDVAKQYHDSHGYSEFLGDQSFAEVLKEGVIDGMYNIDF